MKWTPARIKYLRARVDENQVVFAARFRATVNALRNWEQGRGVPSGPVTVLFDQLEEELGPEFPPEPTPAAASPPEAVPA